jgi:hypothetical protein
MTSLICIKISLHISIQSLFLGGYVLNQQQLQQKNKPRSSEFLSMPASPHFPQMDFKVLKLPSIASYIYLPSIVYSPIFFSIEHLH